MTHIPNDTEDASRPSECPFCGSTALGTLAKAITPQTHWRCARCGEGWSNASIAAATRLPKTRRTL